MEESSQKRVVSEYVYKEGVCREDVCVEVVFAGRVSEEKVWEEIRGILMKQYFERMQSKVIGRE